MWRLTQLSGFAPDLVDFRWYSARNRLIGNVQHAALGEEMLAVQTLLVFTAKSLWIVGSHVSTREYSQEGWQGTQLWSIVENRRFADGRVLQRHVLYLGEMCACHDRKPG